MGGGEPPFVGVDAGHNERMAWGFTFAGTDMVDVFVEEVSPEDQNLVRWQDGWEPLRVIEEEALSERSSRAMLEILHDQEFRSGIPAGLPDTARVANKTGEISTVAHDAGLVYLPGRRPYALAILTEWSTSSSAGRRETLASLSRAVYEHLCPRGSDA